MKKNRIQLNGDAVLENIQLVRWPVNGELLIIIIIIIININISNKKNTNENFGNRFMSRARQIEEFTMLTENALSLIALARQKVHLKDEVDRQMRKLHDDLNTVKVVIQRGIRGERERER